MALPRPKTCPHAATIRELKLLYANKKRTLLSCSPSLCSCNDTGKKLSASTLQNVLLMLHHQAQGSMSSKQSMATGVVSSGFP